jgi:hypothetical protein
MKSGRSARARPAHSTPVTIAVNQWLRIRVCRLRVSHIEQPVLLVQVQTIGMIESSDMSQNDGKQRRGYLQPEQIEPSPGGVRLWNMSESCEQERGIKSSAAFISIYYILACVLAALSVSICPLHNGSTYLHRRIILQALNDIRNRHIV